jgi:hypothetical protein
MGTPDEMVQRDWHTAQRCQSKDLGATIQRLGAGAKAGGQDTRGVRGGECLLAGHVDSYACVSARREANCDGGYGV